MLFNKEIELENHWRNLLCTTLGVDERFKILEGKNVADLIICRDGSQPISFFLELKLYKTKSNRIGIGNKDSNSFQPEIIRKHPEYFEKYLRWIICKDDDKEDKQYVIVTTSSIKNNYLCGGKLGAKGNKQNNIRIDIFQKEPLLSETELLEKLITYLQTT
ncbi:hypothetical protein X793_05615 [Dehalococcoides mccartyi CG4]|uniref:hypothetical protein n=1 Tax=Dehalococcoides mccartyi TaxID=61435 RepID=UPI0004E042E3|nr:hypothetical protein [Dehalococcoides mccartyi]AII60226.1 hypothetical protein X793_05615 [Dehalococcoides mccartyi CG4]